jgi:RND superfamily putative drug exporter
VLSLDEPVTSPAGEAAVRSYVTDAQAIPGVSEAAVSQARGDTVAVDIAYPGQALDSGAKAIVHQLRGLPHPAGVSDVHVGGYTAEVVDRLSDLGSRLPWMALIVALATFVLLFLAFGSVVVPIKAIAMNILSLAATFGVVTWISRKVTSAGCWASPRPARSTPPNRSSCSPSSSGVHGLRGIPAVAHTGAVRPHR